MKRENIKRVKEIDKSLIYLTRFIDEENFKKEELTSKLNPAVVIYSLDSGRYDLREVLNQLVLNSNEVDKHLKYIKNVNNSLVLSLLKEIREKLELELKSLD